MKSKENWALGVDVGSRFSSFSIDFPLFCWRNVRRWKIWRTSDDSNRRRKVHYPFTNFLKRVTYREQHSINISLGSWLFFSLRLVFVFKFPWRDLRVIFAPRWLLQQMSRGIYERFISTFFYNFINPLTGNIINRIKRKSNFMPLLPTKKKPIKMFVTITAIKWNEEFNFGNAIREFSDESPAGWKRIWSGPLWMSRGVVK